MAPLRWFNFAYLQVYERLNRGDGWPGLERAYGLPQEPRGPVHGIAHEALAGGQIDVTNINVTDAKIAR